VRILVTGAGGLVGSALVPALRDAGAEVLRAVRRPASAADEVRWDVASGEVRSTAPLDAVVHLAGSNLSSGRWTPRRKQEIEHSRVEPTRTLSERLARRTPPPRVLVCASAIGYYGDCGDRVLTESSPPGNGFLPEVAERWERACDPARKAGIRVVHLRSGMILSNAGGTLPALLPAFRLGLGGPMGGGRQFWSWIARADVLGVIRRSIDDASLEGAVNVVSPEPLRQAEFARALGRVLHRPTVLPAPAFALRLLLGEMADALVLASARVVPERLRSIGYGWQHPHLEGALRHALSAGRVDGGGAHA
jgi:uncharacterized protein